MLTGLSMAKWNEIDFDKGIWEIPKERMKVRRIHIRAIITSGKSGTVTA